MRRLLVTLLAICLTSSSRGDDVSHWTEKAIDEPGIHGRLFVHDRQARPTLLVLGGSEGGVEGARELATELAGLGYNTFAFAYFGAPGTPPALVKIPLESFSHALDWLEKQPFAAPGAVGIAGGSKGAEAALLVAGIRPELRVAVAYMPTHVVWECIDEQHGAVASSWTLDGKELPFVPYHRRLASSTAASNFGWETVRDLHIASLVAAGPDAVARALIPVDHIRAAVLLFSAGDDLIWPSKSSADDLETRARALKSGPVIKHIDFPNAGHAFIHGSAEADGTEEATRAAQKDSLRELKSFISQYLPLEVAK